MFKKLIGLIVLFIFLSESLIAQSMKPSLTEEQRDFMGRTLGGYMFWEQLLPIIEQFITGQSPKIGQSKEQEKKINEFITKHPMLVLTLAKYLTSEELRLITDFIASREVKDILGRISKKLIAKDEKFKQDMQVLKEELLTIFSKVKEQIQGKSSSSTSLFNLQLLQVAQESSFKDKTRSIEKSLAARQLLEAILPLLEDIMRKKLSEVFKNEVEGVKISIAVSQFKKNLKEHPMIIISLVEYLEMQELSQATDFFSNKTIRSMVGRMSQISSSGNDQFRRDIQRCFLEMASFPSLQKPSEFFQNGIFSFFKEFVQGESPQQPFVPEAPPPQVPIKETTLPEEHQNKEPKISTEVPRKEGQKKSKTNK